MIAFVSNQAPDSPAVATAVHQLIEQGILFTGWETQQLPDRIPDDLEKCEAAIIDEEILKSAAPAERRRLEKYALDKYLWILRTSYRQESIFLVEFLQEVDMNLFASQAGLHPGELPQISDELIIRGFVEQARKFWQSQMPSLNEYHLHFLEGALALENTPYAPEDWTKQINDAIEDIYLNLSLEGNHDQVAGASLLNIYAERTGHSEARNKMVDVVSRLLASRPRTPEGFMAMAGDLSDPLFFNGLGTPFFGDNGYTVVGRHIVTNELFHFYGGLFAACAEAGRPEMLDEALRIMEHIDRFHRDRDGLLYHASRFGKVIGGKWGRGNTHALLGAFYMLRRHPNMPEDIRKKVLSFIDRSGDGLLKVQSPGGLWRNVLDESDSCEETSCSVLITYIYSWCVNMGYLPADKYVPMLLKSRQALKRKFWHGIGSGNCRGSFPALENPGYYRRRSMHGYVMPLIAPALLESARLQER